MSEHKPLLHFLVFSYNRGDFLKNCVDSIRTCIPFARISVWDDNSTDALTRRILEQLGTEVQIHSSPYTDAKSMHGGLYGNMQLAMQASSPDDLICAIQDDMQIVRPVKEAEFLAWNTQLSAAQHRGFIHPVFLKNDKDKILPGENSDWFYVDRAKRSAGAYYSDIFMIRRSLLQQADWQFDHNEAGNEQQARAHFSPMAYLKNPFIAWLPAVPAWRGKRQTWALRYAEKSRRCGLYPFNIMTDEQAAAFCQRSDTLPPYAEKYLQLTNDTLKKPWFYQPLKSRPLLRQLHKVEQAWRRR